LVSGFASLLAFGTQATLITVTMAAMARARRFFAGLLLFASVIGGSL
jgi:short subunit fatty acids transporter